MKNIHILQTDKQSRLYEDVDGDLQLGYDFIVRQGMLQNQNIYITSDEEGDYVLSFLEDESYGMPFKIEENHFNCGFDFKEDFKKIILTTDQDLIKDGVQSIPDEFLEWFVKNPSCEEVKLENHVLELGYNYYKIIIPKEEPKQETPDEYLQVCEYCSSEEVARCKWVNVNTEEIYSADSGTTLEWCFDCKSETNIIDKEDYGIKI